ncbi:BatA domain-containing protein [Algoriphagus sp. SE2]|uniref:BatA domain-containing protein n=1 Tax=Algoriphagus sp. SE2 TaxID=3141536 RepID=UPI0031CD7FAD
MEFLQPILLWGLLGLSIPIAIHLWNGKKGNKVSWAAMAWLSEQENQSSKSIRLDQLFVLILRMLMIILLVFLLSKLILNSWTLEEELKIIHLVASDKQVYEEYRFELEQAIERGEDVFWLEPDLTDISNEINPREHSSQQIQKTLNKLPSTISELNLYFPNSENYLGDNLFISPIKPKIHLAKTAFKKANNSVIAIDSSRVLEMNEFGILAVSSFESSKQATAVLKNLGYYFGEIEDETKLIVQAALNSISTVMKIKFDEVQEMEQAKLIFDRNFPEKIDGDKLYFLFNKSGFPHHQNVLFLPETLSFESTEMVQEGEFPEYLLRELVNFSGLKNLDTEVTQKQIESRFMIKEEDKQNKKSGLEILLSGLFILTFGMERYFSNQRGI